MHVPTCLYLGLCLCWDGWRVSSQLTPRCGNCWVQCAPPSILRAPPGPSPPLQPEPRAQHWVFLPQRPAPRPGHTEGGLMKRGGGHSAA